MPTRSALSCKPLAGPYDGAGPMARTAFAWGSTIDDVVDPLAPESTAPPANITASATPTSANDESVVRRSGELWEPKRVAKRVVTREPSQEPRRVGDASVWDSAVL